MARYLFVHVYSCSLRCPGEDSVFSTDLFSSVVVIGHPYSAQSTLETSVTILNGNHRSSRIYARQIFRDGAGRIRIEEPFLTGAPLGTLPVVIEIQDVMGRARYIWTFNDMLPIGLSMDWQSLLAGQALSSPPSCPSMSH